MDSFSTTVTSESACSCLMAHQHTTTVTIRCRQATPSLRNASSRWEVP